ncbi:hypothetical protein L1987_70660 [Smallanthus sonchifolius]|uniref:Uncharacterized protein n=1 Tax=Smallanthus sonchifolius TaxID=185202 RepID=A0ACB9AQV9_9ASTR|nr:hypothetical protein L1987_70660 [Smallanthus sonchifolius]
MRTWNTWLMRISVYLIYWAHLQHLASSWSYESFTLTLHLTLTLIVLVSISLIKPNRINPILQYINAINQPFLRSLTHSRLEKKVSNPFTLSL